MLTIHLRHHKYSILWYIFYYLYIVDFQSATLWFIIILVSYWVLKFLSHFMCYKYVDNGDDENDTFLLKLVKFCFYPQCLLPLLCFLFYLSFHFFPENQYGSNCIIIVKTQKTNKVKNRNDYNLILLVTYFDYLITQIRLATWLIASCWPH